MRYHGFSLLELMTALVIAGILIMLCLPIYSEHLSHARRLEAEVNLIKLANALEQYHIINNTYQNASLSTLGLADKIAHEQYQLSITSATDVDYILQAVPLGKQAQNDVSCATLLLNSAGKRAITGIGQLTDCWQ